MENGGTELVKNDWKLPKTGKKSENQPKLWEKKVKNHWELGKIRKGEHWLDL